MSNPLVSVVTSCYNQEKYIVEMMESVVMQTYTNWELILVDDKSTDNSVKVIRDFVKKKHLEKKIRLYYHKENRGCGKTLRDAVEKSKGNIITVLDGDDVLAYPYVLWVVVQCHRENPRASLVYSNYILCDENWKPKRTITTRALNSGETYLQHDYGVRVSHLKSFKRSYYNKTVGVDCFLRNGIDKDLVLKLEEVGLLVHIPLVLYLMRAHDKSLSRSIQNRSKIYQKTVALTRRRIVENAKARRKYNKK